MFNQQLNIILLSFDIDDESLSDISSECSDLSLLSDLDLECQSVNYNLCNGSPIETNNFNLAHYNINSILADDRLEQLSDICKILCLDVLIITESKLDQNIPTNLIMIPGYHEPVRRDRLSNGRNGGGTLIYVAQNHVFQHKPELQSEYFEHLWVDIKIGNVSFAINAIYRPPNESPESHS